MSNIWNKFFNKIKIQKNNKMSLYKFGKKSSERLKTCDSRLQDILTEAIKIIDFTILEGHRNKEDQNRAFDDGKSQVQYPNSKHNSYPSKAADLAPYPIDWTDEVRFAHLIGIIRGIAYMKGYKLRVGIDWDRDGEIRDHKFLDFPHIEILD